MSIVIKFPHELSRTQREIVQTCIRKGAHDAWQQGIDTDKTTFDIRYIQPRENDSDYLIGIQVEGPRNIKVGVHLHRVEHDTARFCEALHRLTTHELNHIERIDNNGIPVVTLADALISEGLAQTAELVAGHQPALWTRFHSQSDAEKYIVTALKHLDDRLDSADKTANTNHHDYSHWFFGPNATDPGFGGYPLGQAIIGRYLAESWQDMADLTRLPTQIIISHWQADLERQGIPAWVENNFEPLTYLCPTKPQRKGMPPELILFLG